MTTLRAIETLRAGDQVAERDGYLLTVESVTVSGRTVTVVCRDGMGNRPTCRARVGRLVRVFEL